MKVLGGQGPPMAMGLFLIYLTIEEEVRIISHFSVKQVEILLRFIPHEFVCELNDG